MDVTPVDQGAVLRSGQQATPNYAEQAMREALLRVQQQEANTQQQAVTSLVSQRNREATQQAAFQEAVGQLGPNPTAAQIAQLMYRFPEMSEALKRGYDALDNDEQRQTFQALASVTAAARNGNFELAARLMRSRVEADRAAGHEEPMDTAILQALESPEAGQRQYAVDMLERSVAAVNPERYAQVYGTFSRNVQFHNGLFVDGNTGAVIGQDPRGTIIPGSNGSFNQVMPIEGVPSITGGEIGPPAAMSSADAGPDMGGRQDGGAFDFSQGAAPAPAAPSRQASPRPARGEFDRQGAVSLAGQFGRVTSTVRTPEHNREVGGVPNSNHLARNGGRAIDIARGRGVSHAQIVAAYRAAGYVLDPDTRDEGDHSHVVIASGPAGGGGLPRVRSRQEYARLASGAEYLDPNGVRRRKR